MQCAKKRSWSVSLGSLYVLIMCAETLYGIKLRRIKYFYFKFYQKIE